MDIYIYIHTHDEPDDDVRKKNPRRLLKKKKDDDDARPIRRAHTRTTFL